MRNLKIIAAALVLTAAVAGQSQAREAIPDREPAAEHIQVSQIDWRDPAQVKAAYKRLQQAALFVCGVGQGSDAAADRACAEKALRDSVDAVNRPMLTAIHQQAGAPMLARGY